MRIKSLSVKNLRLYGDEEQTINFNVNKNVTVLLGDNGAGKTSLLYGCSVLLSQFFEQFPGCKYKSFKWDDVRNVSNTKKADYLHVGMKLIPSYASSLNSVENHVYSEDANMHDIIPIDMYFKGNEKKETPKSNLKYIKDFSYSIKNDIDSGGHIALPVIAYYGAERGQIKAVERRRDLNDIFQRWDIYTDSLETVTNFKRFFTWFEANEDKERRERERQRNYDYMLPELDAVRRALNLLFDKFENPRVEIDPLRFVMDEVDENGERHERRLERMSDGYRITIALVADIASRMAEANPSYEESGLRDPLQANGIVLIDEIDLHLHPKLQREILRKLTTIFPNVQFIVTTHSPSVVIGALDIVQVVKLNNGEIESNINTSEYDKYDVSLLLLSNLFGLDNVRTREFKVLEDKIENLLKKPNLTEHEHAELKGYVMLQRTYGYSNGEERK